MERIDDFGYIVIDQREKTEEQDRSLTLEIVWPNEAHHTKVCYNSFYSSQIKYETLNMYNQWPNSSFSF